MFRFGEIPPSDEEDTFQAQLSDDRRALTITFSDLVATTEGEELSPMATRMFWLVLPVVDEGTATAAGNVDAAEPPDRGDGTLAEIEFILSGAAVTTEGATATLMVSVNGQTLVRDFGTNFDESFEQTLNFAAHSPPECGLFALLLARTATQPPGGSAFLNVLSIDAEFLPRPD